MESKIIVFFENEAADWNNLNKTFQEQHFIVLRAENLDDTINLVKESRADAILIDWKHGRIKIQSFIKQINSFCPRTVLVVRADKLSYNDQIILLEQGVDECFDQSLPSDLLAAKITALIRRVSIVKQEPRTLRAKDVEINLDTQEVRKGDKIIYLTFTQFKILYLLASQRNYVFTRDEILTKVWGKNSYVTDRTVDVHVKRLREKLGEKNKCSQYIQTIHGLGYRFA